MKNRAIKKIVCIFSLCILILVQPIDANNLNASDRGLKLAVMTTDGNKIDLYRDSHALLIGNSSYSNGWDPIPGAIQDVKEIA